MQDPIHSFRSLLLLLLVFWISESILWLTPPVDASINVFVAAVVHGTKGWGSIVKKRYQRCGDAMVRGLILRAGKAGAIRECARAVV